MIIFMGFIVILLIALIMIFRMMQMRELELENQMMQTYMQSMEELYAAIQDRIEATRRYRHDLAKHIQTLEVLLDQQEEENKEMREYMDDLVGRFCTLKKAEFCGDEIINSILSVKKQQCDRKEIPLQIQVEDAFYDGVQEVEIVGLLHNLLDNAIEANERISENGDKGITFSMGKKGKEIWIRLDNYICPGEEINFQTKKSNKEEHGIGRKIIDNLITKYNGTKITEVDKMHNMLHETITLTGV